MSGLLFKSLLARLMKFPSAVTESVSVARLKIINGERVFQHPEYPSISLHSPPDIRIWGFPRWWRWRSGTGDCGSVQASIAFDHLCCLASEVTSAHNKDTAESGVAEKEEEKKE